MSCRFLDGLVRPKNSTFKTTTPSVRVNKANETVVNVFLFLVLTNYQIPNEPLFIKNIYIYSTYLTQKCYFQKQSYMMKLQLFPIKTPDGHLLCQKILIQMKTQTFYMPWATSGRALIMK